MISSDLQSELGGCGRFGLETAWDQMISSDLHSESGGCGRFGLEIAWNHLISSDLWLSCVWGESDWRSLEFIGFQAISRSVVVRDSDYKSLEIKWFQAISGSIVGGSLGLEIAWNRLISSELLVVYIARFGQLMLIQAISVTRSVYWRSLEIIWFQAISSCFACFKQSSQTAELPEDRLVCSKSIKIAWNQMISSDLYYTNCDTQFAWNYMNIKRSREPRSA